MRRSAQVAVTHEEECKAVEGLTELSPRWTRHCIPTDYTFVASGPVLDQISSVLE